MRHQVLDSAENLFFMRQLENIETTMYTTDFPDLKHSLLIPTETGFDPGAVKLTYRQITQVGQAHILSDKSKKLPRVDVFGEEVPTPVRMIGDSFGYSIMEIKGAAKSGQALESMRANAAVEIILRKLESIAALGDAESGLEGLLNHRAVTPSPVPNGAKGSPNWKDKTDGEVLDDMNGIVSEVRAKSLGIESPDTLLMPELQYTEITSRRLSHTSTTLLQYFLSTNPWIKHVEPWHFLSGAGAGGTSRMVAYRRDPNKLKLRNPHAIEQLPPVLEGLEYVVGVFMATAGVVIYKPGSMAYRDGI